MYNTRETAARIKDTAKGKGIKISEMLSACGLCANTLSSMSNRGSWIQANSLALIADYLNVSVDFLLGRTESGIDTDDVELSIGGVKYRLIREDEHK